MDPPLCVEIEKRVSARETRYKTEPFIINRGDDAVFYLTLFNLHRLL